MRQRLPHITIGTEIFFAVFSGSTHLVHQERQYTIFANILGDILLGVVGSHRGSVVDVLLEDITQHIGVDVLACGGMAVIEMPVPLVEECKQTLKCFIGDVDVGILLFQSVHVEHTSVEVWDASIHALKFLRVTRVIQTVMKELGEETSIERMEKPVFTLLTSHPCQFVTEIVSIIVEEAFLLNKVTEHEAVEHDAGIPLLVLVLLHINFVVNTRDKLDKSRVLFAEALIEILCQFLRVHYEGRLDALFHIHDSSMLVYIKGQSINL